jgi:hypothetical protein
VKSKQEKVKEEEEFVFLSLSVIIRAILSAGVLTSIYLVQFYKSSWRNKKTLSVVDITSAVVSLSPVLLSLSVGY